MITKVLPYITALLMGFVGLRYSYLTISRKSQPALATWLLFSVTTILSLATYFSTKNHSISANILNVMDVFMCNLIALSIVVTNYKNIRFTRLEIICLIASGGILLLWAATKNPTAANILLQLIITIGYFPTIARLWIFKEETESLSIWIVIWLATLSGLISASLRYDTLATVYALRALLFCSLVFVLILRGRNIPRSE